jgi:hypothetical protein
MVEVEQAAHHPVHNGPLIRASSSNATGLFSGSREQSSPFQRYRSWNRVLSVSDLVSPAWYVTMNILKTTVPTTKLDMSRCELQFDYGLRQKRSRKLEDRPASFTSAEGKIISVEKQVAAKNDRTVQRGRVRTATFMQGFICVIDLFWGSLSTRYLRKKFDRKQSVYLSVVTENAGLCGVFDAILTCILTETYSYLHSLVNILSGIHTLMTLGCTVSTIASCYFMLL